MRLIIVFSLFISILPKLEAQSYAEEYYKYDRLNKMMKGYYNRGLYHKSVLYPDSLEGNKYVNGSSYYLFARVYSLSNQFDKTLVNLKKAVKRGITKAQIERMYDLDGFRESNMYIIYEMNYNKWHQEYLLKEQNIAFDSVYIKAIRKIETEYASNFESRKEDGDEIYIVRDSLTFYTKREQLDSLRFQSFVDLTIEKGFPIKRSIGKDYYNYSRILRYNIPENYNEECQDWQKIKTLIFAEIEKGTVFPFYYAALEDYFRLNDNRPQLYGTIPVQYKKNKDVSSLIEYETPKELNVRRRSVGLCSIQLEMWSEAREMPISLKEVDFK